MNRLPGNPSRLISDVNSSIDYKSTMTATASAQLQQMQKQQYSDRVMKKIMSKQINTQTDLEQV